MFYKNLTFTLARPSSECFLGIVSLAYIMYIEQTAKVGPKIVFPNSHKHIQSHIAAALERKFESIPYLLFFTLYT